MKIINTNTGISIVILFLLLGLSSLTFIPLSPPGAIGPYLNGIFPPTTPGAQGQWEIVDPMPSITVPSPVRVVAHPTLENRLLVLSKQGQIWEVSIQDEVKRLVLDIQDRTFKLGDGGSVGMALHPMFGDENHPDKQSVYIFYRTKPEPEKWTNHAFNRLSRFSWDADMEIFDPQSEEILFQQYDRSPWHDGGGMFFGPDGLLYVALGDEGFEEFQPVSTQRLDGGFFSGLLRIDVDNNPARSHAIRRQPQANEIPPEGWGDTYSRGYSIPNDNPWQNEDGSILEEYYAIGLRSPFTIHYDDYTGNIWTGDVGSDKREEINIIEKGDNLQWPYMEGRLKSEVREKPDSLIGNEKEVFFEYDRAIGSCIIGGGVYRGGLFPSLFGKYLFADYTQNKVVAVGKENDTSEVVPQILIGNLSAQPVSLPEKAGITCMYLDDLGNVFIGVMGEDYKAPGKIFMLRNKASVDDPPVKLSELGVFADLPKQEVIPGLIPYQVNSPLWSDGAVKKRWIALPNDGNYNTDSEQIIFREEDPWTFPEGTVFVKHFDLPVDLDNEDITKPLETRFLVIGENKEVYGLTYQWNDEGTDAILLGGQNKKDFEINQNNSYLFTQTWDYPSREQCMTCHTSTANFVLGVNTHQLNGIADNGAGGNQNQLSYLSDLGIFSNNVSSPSTLPKSYSILNKNIDLTTRIRSYLDANCASCHQYGGLKETSLEFRFSKSENIATAYVYAGLSHASDPNNKIITPGDHTQSELWVRDASEEDNKMPPLGRNLVDQYYVDTLTKWIDLLDENPIEYHDIIVYPNPTEDFLSMRISDSWEGPFEIQVRTISGRLIMQTSSDRFYNILDLSAFPADTYILIVSGVNERKVTKFILI